MSDVALVVSIVGGAGISILLIRLMTLERRLNRLSRLDAKLDALLKHSGIEFDPFGDVPPGAREALERGETILAIKRLRQTTGSGLRETKAFVDDVRRRTLEWAARP